MGYFDDTDKMYQTPGWGDSVQAGQPGSSSMYGQMPGFLQTFMQGAQQRKQGQSPLLSGLSNFAGQGGFAGGLGSVAKFFL